MSGIDGGWRCKQETAVETARMDVRVRSQRGTPLGDWLSNVFPGERIHQEARGAKNSQGSRKQLLNPTALHGLRYEEPC